MRTFLTRLLGAMVAAGVLVLLLEVAFRVLPVVKGIHRIDDAGPGQSQRLMGPRPYTYSTGWDMRRPVHAQVNAQGFVAPRDFVQGERVVGLFGDSFAEGLMFDFPRSPAGQMQAALGGRLPVYNFGQSGTSLPHSLGLARELGRSYRFEGAVVLVGPQDYIDGFTPDEGSYHWADPAGTSDTEILGLTPVRPRSKLNKIVRELALVRYMRQNLRVGVDRLLADPFAQQSCRPGILTATDERRLRAVVDGIPAALGLAPERVSMVFLSDWIEVDRRRPDATRCATLDAIALKRLRVLASEAGLRVVNAGEMLAAHERGTGELMDLFPLDRHWNDRAVEKVAAEVARVLNAVDLPSPAVAMPAAAAEGSPPAAAAR